MKDDGLNEGTEGEESPALLTTAGVSLMTRRCVSGRQDHMAGRCGVRPCPTSWGGGGGGEIKKDYLAARWVRCETSEVRGMDGSS